MNLTLPITDIEPLLPHSGDMVLLDEITEFTPDFIVAKTTIKPDNILIKNNILTTFSAIEIMAQAIGAYAGIQNKLQGLPVKLGYLLGSRNLEIFSEQIPIGTTLEIQAKVSITDSLGFSIFECQLMDDSTQKILLKGALNVFSPDEEINLIKKG